MFIAGGGAGLTYRQRDQGPPLRPPISVRLCLPALVVWQLPVCHSTYQLLTALRQLDAAATPTFYTSSRLVEIHGAFYLYRRITCNPQLGAGPRAVRPDEPRPITTRKSRRRPQRRQPTAASTPASFAPCPLPSPSLAPAHPHRHNLRPIHPIPISPLTSLPSLPSPPTKPHPWAFGSGYVATRPRLGEPYGTHGG